MRQAIAIALLSLTFLAGCGGGEPGEPTPEDLGALGARIYQQPDRADSLIEEAGLTREELGQRVRAVASDVEASRRYQEAFDQAVNGPAS